MISLKEVGAMILALIILAFSNSWKNYLPNYEIFINSLVIFAVILVVYVASKKAMAWYLESEEETRILMLQRYGYYERSYLKTKIPIGLILPFVLSILSLGVVKWFGVLESEIRGTKARAARRHDYYSFAELTEWHIALISAAGIFGMFILAIIAYLLNFPEVSKLAIYYAAFNMIPLGGLDGLKVFFGSRPLFSIIWIINIIGLVYAWLLP